jgi:sugar-specific transcriptional regulator TrmB
MTQYATGDADDPNLPDTICKTFDMGVKPVVVPVLDFNRLKQVKAYKDWYGYSQKLEKSVKILRTKIKKIEDEQIETNSKYNKVLNQNRSLYALNEKLNTSIKRLNEKLKIETKARNKFEMTMPNVGPNYVSFTMMDMHKTINNSKNEILNMSGNYDGLNHSFNDSDRDGQTNLQKEINQFSQNNSSKGMSHFMYRSPKPHSHIKDITLP